MPTSDFEKLKSKLNETPYLVVNVVTNKASLESPDQVLSFMGDQVHFIMDLKKGLPKFKKLTDKSVFSLSEIAAIAQVDYYAAHAWLREKVISPSIKNSEGAGRGQGPQFSFADAFAAGVIGTLRRHRISLKAMRSIGPLLNSFLEKTAPRK